MIGTNRFQKFSKFYYPIFFYSAMGWRVHRHPWFQNRSIDKTRTNIYRLIVVYLNNYFRLHVCLSFRTSVRPYLRMSVRSYVRHTFIFFDFLQLFHKMSLIKVAWHVLRVKNMHLGSPSDPSGTAAAEAKPRCV